MRQKNNMFIDVHCHLDKIIEEGVSAEQAIKNANAKGVNIIIVNGTDHEQNIKVLDLAKKHEEVKAALGIYPLDALELSESEIDEEIKFIMENKRVVVAIGEVGLDLKEEELHKTLDKQKIILAKFVNLAIKLNKPIIVHSRKAELHTIELLEQLKAKKVIMHCFSGKMSLVDRIVVNGWSLSIPANVNYNQQFQDVVKRVPLQSLLCETDSPFLHPLKEWPNEPSNVIYSYKKIAKIKSTSLKQAEQEIESNYLRLFEQ
ncbi:MAG: TatD family hydrolase [Nanoarchaeota archaeon]